MRNTIVIVSLFVSHLVFSLPTHLQAQSRELGRRLMDIEIDGKMTRVLLSPNEDLVLWSANVGGDREIMVAGVNGNDVRKLTEDQFFDYQPEWSPDGDRILFTSIRSGQHQIYSIDLTGGDVKQLTDNEHGSRRPMFSAEGHFVWQEMHERKGKVHPIDVKVRLAESDQVKTLLEKIMLPSYSWHPDGQVLAVGCIGSIQFINVKDNKRKTVSFPNVDERLNSHGARQIEWSPDGTQIACRIGFVGGSIGDGKIFGDEEIFLIDREGEVNIFDDLESAKESHDWITIK